MTHSARRGSSLDGVRVLLVDDHPVVRQVITRLLEERGVKVMAVTGASEALEALERERPSVVLSDIHMPGDDGYALIRKIRALPPDRGGQIPAVALTRVTGVEEQARVLRAGFQDHVAKPIDARRLVEVVTMLGKQSVWGGRIDTPAVDEPRHNSVESHRPAERRPDLIGRGAAVGYTGAYREPGDVDVQDVVAAQTAKGPV